MMVCITAITWSGTNKNNNNRTREVRIDFEEFDGDLDALISDSSDGDKYLLRMVAADSSDDVRIELCEVFMTMSGTFGLIGGRFHFDWSHMRVVGVCKILCD